jgi:hypothetical protein
VPVRGARGDPPRDCSRLFAPAMRTFGIYLQLVGLMLGASSLIIGMQTNDPNTQLSLVAVALLVFYIGHSLRNRGSSES